MRFVGQILIKLETWFIRGFLQLPLWCPHGSNLCKHAGGHSVTTKACTLLAWVCLVWRSGSSLELSAQRVYKKSWFATTWQRKIRLHTTVMYIGRNYLLHRHFVHINKMRSIMIIYAIHVIHNVWVFVLSSQIFKDFDSYLKRWSDISWPPKNLDNRSISVYPVNISHSIVVNE